ncbi:hypothetical protein GE21DRAFT_9807 [Neurospora crassa]|uniref:Uncharacterized protein n=1 Tax=Neurospora crassa (strain ATCC 24698 / 74-OR23-1A / CBS 708.71 / DSM 1257 / FGSC 987) TaxID=367110 RepID=V5IKG6_NEUCR|nr:hypothetical protein NCU12044 [Neurospora crassa OR74A]ESA41832.1 hypothetical protein NCU12044 [Neurospora crassa OR74A]KHE82579.1 hypothetical protein GE21DRAFT_9807 [Neurospora crassa]|eukprot:XP_011395333.1 hypothetical protein NCU12044 [Neurospora crassa OR74A]
MDSTKDVIRKLANLNIDSCAQTPEAVQVVNASHPPSPDQTPGPDPFGPASPAGFQTQSGTQSSFSNDKRTKPEEAIATATCTDSESPKNIIPLRKPSRNISRNLAESSAKGVQPRSSNRPHTTSITTKCRDRMRMGVVDFLRRDASKGVKRWLQGKERRHDSTRRATRIHRRGALSEGVRKRLGLKLKREEASLGQLEVIKEEEEEEEEGEDVKMEEDMKIEEDTVMAD